MRPRSDRRYARTNEKEAKEALLLILEDLPSNFREGEANVDFSCMQLQDDMIFR